MSVVILGLVFIIFYQPTLCTEYLAEMTGTVLNPCEPDADTEMQLLISNQKITFLQTGFDLCMCVSW